MKLKTLDEARKAFLNQKITPEEFYAYLKKHSYVNQEMKEIDKSFKRLEKN